jgi:hypothetical protein
MLKEYVVPRMANPMWICDNAFNIAQVRQTCMEVYTIFTGNAQLPLSIVARCLFARQSGVLGERLFN